MKHQDNKIVLIVAGGSGNRMQSDIPKQFLPIGQVPLLIHTFNRFIQYDQHITIRLVLPQREMATWKEIIHKNSFTFPHEIFPGGNTRFESVQNGLDGIEANSLIAIHDGVRPFVSLDTISACFSAAAEFGAAIPVVAMKDSLREQSNGTNKPVDREKYFAIQTPQVFKSDILLKAYKAAAHTSFTDDATVVENIGQSIKLVEGSYENIKITTPTDILIAESFLKAGI